MITAKIVTMLHVVYNAFDVCFMVTLNAQWRKVNQIEYIMQCMRCVHHGDTQTRFVSVASLAPGGHLH